MNDSPMNENKLASDDAEIANRRLFLQSLGKWSGAAITAAVTGTWLGGSTGALAGGAWINRRGVGGGAWVNGGGGGGGWINRRGGGGAWINGR
jgi:hypothetical protein